MGADIVLPTFSVFLNWTLCNSLILMAIEARGLDLSSLLIVELGVACNQRKTRINSSYGILESIRLVDTSSVH